MDDDLELDLGDLQIPQDDPVPQRQSSYSNVSTSRTPSVQSFDRLEVPTADVTASRRHSRTPSLSAGRVQKAVTDRDLDLSLEDDIFVSDSLPMAQISQTAEVTSRSCCSLMNPISLADATPTRKYNSTIFCNHGASASCALPRPRPTLLVSRPAWLLWHWPAKCTPTNTSFVTWPLFHNSRSRLPHPPCHVRHPPVAPCARLAGGTLVL